MPRFIALCGYPKSGKSEVQRIVERLYGFEAVDDSAPLREAGKALYGLTDWHVSTQEGKATVIRVGGKRMTVRKALGDLGDYLEEGDPYHLPRLAVRSSTQRSPGGRFVFASVRKDQPIFFRQTGEAIVMEVVRTGTEARNAFDEYDRSAIDLSVENALEESDIEGSLKLLEARVSALLDPILPRASAPVRTA